MLIVDCQPLKRILLLFFLLQGKLTRVDKNQTLFMNPFQFMRDRLHS